MGVNKMCKYELQAENFLKKTNTKFETKFIDHKYYFDDDKYMRDVYRVTLKHNGKQFSFAFGQSVKESGEKELTPYDVLACLQKYEVGTFEAFCSEFGCSNDSIRALKTYKAVCREYKGLRRLFNDKEMSLLRYIQ
jgi:hypothetical protein